MRAYVRKVLPVVPEGIQLTWSLFDSSSSSFPLVDFIWVTTQSTLWGRYRQHIVNPTQIFDHFILIHQHQNVFLLLSFIYQKVQAIPWSKFPL